MSRDSTSPTLRDVGYRRAILVLGAFWGAAPALGFGLQSVASLSSAAGLLVVGGVTTLTLAVLYELDSRVLDEHGRGVDAAWSYALVAPLSVVAWVVLGPLLLAPPVLAVLALLVGPPASALSYLWQRGRRARVA